MVPLPNYTTVRGVPITKLMPKKSIDAIIKRTRMAGGEIVKNLKTGSAFYAPGASAIEMVEAILKDSKKIMPCAAYLNGEYGIKGIYMGVPVKLGKKGIEGIVKIKLTAAEKKSLMVSSKKVKEMILKV